MVHVQIHHRNLKNPCEPSVDPPLVCLEKWSGYAKPEQPRGGRTGSTFDVSLNVVSLISI